MRPFPSTIARRLAMTIERAIRCGQFEHADRLAKSAARLIAASPRLTECIARLRLLQGRAETALSIVEASRFRTDSLRLLRAVCLLETGRAVEAHLDLREWCRSAIASAEAQRLLALLEWETGDRSAAVRALQPSVREGGDAKSLELLLIDAVAEHREAQAQQWAAHLLGEARWGRASVEPAMLFETLGMDASKVERAEPIATPRRIATLAMEIVAAEETGSGGAEPIIGALLRAQQIAPQPDACELLYGGIESALPSLRNQSAACEALARFAMLLDRRADALIWAKRGVELNPMSAALTRLVNELTPTQPDSDIQIETRGRLSSRERSKAA